MDEASEGLSLVGTSVSSWLDSRKSNRPVKIIEPIIPKGSFLEQMKKDRETS